MAGWHFEFTERASLPALAWVAVVRPGTVRVQHGSSVRRADAGFFEGTWAGPPSLAAISSATTVFGSGIVEQGDYLLAIGPSHHLEGIYLARREKALIISNSFVGTLVSADLELDPAFDYPSLFLAPTGACWLIEDPADGHVIGSRFNIPTRSTPVGAQFYENVRIGRDLSTVGSRKPRELAFESFSDYSSRLITTAASLFANGRSYRPVAALSSGYDSTAVAVVAVKAGCSRSIGFTTARPSSRDPAADDSGAAVANLLGLRHEERDRLEYRRRTDLVEAEFLSAGMTGEDMMFAAFETDLRGQMLVTGYWAGTEFAMSRRGEWRRVASATTAGADLGEFRLRADFLHAPLAVFGAARPLDAPSLLDRAEMEPFRIGGRYDRPIPRRLAEEAGVPRAAFGRAKHAVNVLLPREGTDGLTTAARESIERFAAAEGSVLSIRRRRPFSRVERAVIKGARALRLGGLAAPLERRRASLTHFEPATGNLLLRWAVDVVAQRYADLERAY